MRKILLWVLVGLMVLSAAALAESTAAPASINSYDAVRTATDLYFAIPAADSGEMLVRLPLAGGDAICVDRGDKFEDMIPYSGGLAYLKTTANASAIMCCVGNNISTLYGFGSTSATNLTAYNDELLVLSDGLLYSINPNTQVCLKLSGAQMLDYVLGEGCAYYISNSDKMEYTAQLGSGDTVTTQAGCIYRLDLSTGETTLLLKSGGTDLQISGSNLYFHNLADAYAVRTADTGDTQLCGRLYSLDALLKTLNKECTEPDNGFWAVKNGVVVLFNGALNAGETSLYTPENGAFTFSDGENVYTWESGKKTLTQVGYTGEVQTLYEKDLTEAVDVAALIPIETPAPEVSQEPGATPSTSDWFDQFVANTEEAEKVTASSSSGSSSASSSSAAPASASAAGSTVRTNDSVKLRSGPGSSYNQTGSVPAGTELSCQGETTAANGTIWYKVNYNGTTGYIYAGYADVVNTAPVIYEDETSVEASSSSSGSSSSGSTSYSTYDVSGKYVRIKGGSVNLRKGPGTAFAVITSIPNGTYVTFQNKGAKNADGSRWYKVKYKGYTGWVSKGYSEVTSSGGGSSTGVYDMDGKYVYTEGSVNVRSSASLNAKSLGSVGKGKYLDFANKGCTDSRGVRWYKVYYNGGTGWVSSRYCVIKNSKSGGGGENFVRTTGSVNLRKGPGLDYGTCGSVGSGKKLEYLGTSKKDSRGVRWYKVKYNGNTCWVSSRYSTLIS